ncbi:D-alanyl-D-alanine carboxypeptidase family protein [Rhizobacter sp. SG703]|uniref:D-alanyl-D-alanine carboxypeptidase family protein n=1 Tax=Rhizobacter sp. SG703 TaxID=2587140 RepID=UPI001446E2CB|nr:D-alanyl-D-alanine carboxypeptidase family protein [Rhizobacter sp. SG703]NKI96667.1 murein DD-endopeptidase MepM/ murein hydrolase activator NlpD/peptidoglycan hydrolase-like protein with peptidoglycan-binding domain/D-alanyl-D-alanine dipeptidase [Rhizobacter sp. SG703]
MKPDSPFLSAYPAQEQETAPDLPMRGGAGPGALLFESPYVQLALVGHEAAFGADSQQECEACGCHELESADEPAGELDNECEVDDTPVVNAPLSAGDRAWVLDLQHSALERLPDPALQRKYLKEVAWKDIEFPDNVPPGGSATAAVKAHWALSERLFVDMARVTPERRVNLGDTKIAFRAHRPVAVPGQAGQQLYAEAAEAFLRMREAALQEGVQLDIASSWRSPAHQAQLSAGQPNAKAVAGKNSAHMYGLAVDLQMSVRGLDLTGKSQTRTAEKMAKLVRMYRSPVYKWMMLRAKGFGWYPYRREPWHWEYNPPGLKARFEGGSSAAPALPSGTSTTTLSGGGQTPAWVRFAQRVLNATEGERLSDDGNAGPMTRAALARFRDKHRLGSSSGPGSTTDIALTQRALERLAQASMFASYGTRDAKLDQALAAFRAERHLGFGAVLDPAIRNALADALPSASSATSAKAPAAASAASAASAAPSVGATPVPHLGGQVWLLKSAAHPEPVAIFVPKAALGQASVDVLFHVHGLLIGASLPPKPPAGFITAAPFRLGALVDAAGLPMVVVVPAMNWNAPGGVTASGQKHPRWSALARPERLNALLADVLADVARVQGLGQPPSLQRLVVSGHSRAYDFLEPLRALHADPQMGQGALAQLAQVWAFDSTYAGDPADWKRWLADRPGLQAHFFYIAGSPTHGRGDAFHAARGGNLHVTKVSKAQHHQVPGLQLPALLAGLTGAADHELDDWLPMEGEDPDALEEIDRQDESGDDEMDELVDELSDELEAAHDDEEPACEDPGHEDVDHERADDEGADDEAESFENDEEAAAEAEVDEAFEAGPQTETPDALDLALGDKAPLPVPAARPVPFAPLPPQGSHWPLRTAHPQARVISYKFREPDGIEGRAGRMFLAERKGQRHGVVTRRRHVGVDLFAKVGDVVQACESGTIVSFAFFYKAASGQSTYRLLIEHEGSGVVVNYGELTKASLKQHGLAVGDRVSAGQPIGFVSDTAMLHFETYVKGSRATARWWRDEKNAPASLLNPTRYLLALRENVAGTDAAGSGAAAGAAGGAIAGAIAVAGTPASTTRPQPPADPAAFRSFRLTTYHVVDQADEPTHDIRIPILGADGRAIADGSPAFFAKLALEGTARLSDGRLVNVTGQSTPVAHERYAAVLDYHERVYARRNARLKAQGRPPVPTRYSGISVEGGRVVRAMTFHEVPAAKRGVGYGTQRQVPYTPFRTLAADLGLKANSEPRWKGHGGLVPAHTPVYIREFDGLTLPDGRGGSFVHDGWFTVNDTGGAIFGAHFDVFTGSAALGRQVRLPAVGQVWFPGIETRVPPGYAHGLKA